MLKDALTRRLIVASFFAAAFVWVAVRYFNVDTEVVWSFLVLSVVLVICLMALGFAFSFLLLWLRRKHRGGMLDRLPDAEDREKCE